MSVTGNVFTIVYATDGAATFFPYPYYLYQFSDLVVDYTPTGGDPQRLVLNTDYSLAGTADESGTYPTGVNLTTIGGLSPLAAGQLQISRFTERTQQQQYIDGDKFPAARTEKALDKLTLMVQELLPNFQGSAVAPPATGDHLVGEWFITDPPVPGGPFGYVCVTAGNPGTWLPFGLISLE